MEGNYVNRNSTHRDRGDHNSFGFEEHTWGTSWPARNYACSFCKREFRSAQALGGHMNVHRRDRARLRSSLSSRVSVSDCPKPDPTTKPNNNPNLLISPSNSSSSAPLSDELLNCIHNFPLYSTCLTLSSSDPSLASTSGDKKPKLTSSSSSSQQFPLLSPQKMEIKMSKNTTTRTHAFDVEELKGCAEEHNITLELGIGLIKQEDKLDLELRLGHF